MFGIGFSEIAVIALVLIILVRPDDLPAFFRKLGRLYAQARSAYNEVASLKDEFLREMDITSAVAEAENPPDPQTTRAEPQQDSGSVPGGNDEAGEPPPD